MEKQLFTWGSWDMFDTLFMSFMDCTFIKNVGKYKVGDKAYCIDMDYENGTMSVYESEDDLDTPSATFKLELHAYELE